MLKHRQVIRPIGISTLVLGVVLFIYGLIYNFSHFLNAEVPILQASLYLIGYGLITISAFILNLKKTGRILIIIFGLFIAWLLVMAWIQLGPRVGTLR